MDRGTKNNDKDKLKNEDDLKNEKYLKYEDDLQPRKWKQAVAWWRGLRISKTNLLKQSILYEDLHNVQFFPFLSSCVIC